MKMTAEKKKGILIQLFVYTIAIVMAILVADCFPEAPMLLKVLYADIAGTLTIFVFSFLLKNSSLYDPYWSVAPIVIATAYLIPAREMDVNPLRIITVFVLVQWWSWRLTLNFLRGWKGMKYQDWRYDDLKEKTGTWFPLVDLFGIQLFPTLLVYAGCLPLYWIFFSDAPFGILDILAIFITGTAISIEMVADNQLHRFMKTKKPGETLTSGLWAYSRHPNYFGEITFWWGLFLFGLAASPQNWYYFIGGAIAITVLFSFISVPMIDKRSLERRENYKEIMDSISGIVPWFPRK